MRDQPPDKYINAFENLMLVKGRGVVPLPDHNNNISTIISEPNLYKLIFRLKAKRAESFTDWVCVEIRPPIRKKRTVAYMTKAIEQYRLVDTTEDAINKY